MSDRAVPFVAAALAGLCAHPRVHDPEKVAETAVAIGLATAKHLAHIEFGGDEPPEQHTGPRFEFRNVEMGGVSEQRVREIIASAFDEFTRAEAPPEG
jgi:hypothetical protein